MTTKSGEKIKYNATEPAAGLVPFEQKSAPKELPLSASTPKATTQVTDPVLSKTQLSRRSDAYLSPTRLQHRQGGRSQKRRPLRGEGEALALGLRRDPEPPVRVAVLGVELDDAARRRHAHDGPPMQTRPWKSPEAIGRVGSAQVSAG